MSAQRWVFPLRTEGPFEADLDDSRIKYVRAADYERDVAAAEVEMMRLISRSIADGHRGNGSAEDDVCCQVCQEIECDPDCAVAEAWAREAAAEARGWNAAVEGAISACQADWRFEDHNDWYLAAVAALRKPEVEG